MGSSRAATLSAALFFGVLSACSDTPPAVEQVRQAVPLASPAVRGSQNGLELSWWVTPADSSTLARALGPHRANPVFFDGPTRSLWEANGLRLVAVPLEKLADLRSRLPAIGSIQREWLGQVPLWTDVIRGPAWFGEQDIALDTGRLTLGPGRVRLLTRCWTIPVPPAPGSSESGADAQLHLEFLLQHQEAPRHAEESIGVDPHGSDPQEEGLLFNRLAAAADLPQGFAYMLVPESPLVDWDRGAGESPESLRSDAPGPQPPDPARAPSLGHITRPGENSLDDPAAPPDSAANVTPMTGPPSAPALSLGQALLTAGHARPSGSAAASGSPSRTARAILILIPRLPQHFRLLPD